MAIKPRTIQNMGYNCHILCVKVTIEPERMSELRLRGKGLGFSLVLQNSLYRWKYIFHLFGCKAPRVWSKIWEAHNQSCFKCEVYLHWSFGEWRQWLMLVSIVLSNPKISAAVYFLCVIVFKKCLGKINTFLVFLILYGAPSLPNVNLWVFLTKIINPKTLEPLTKKIKSVLKQ